MFAEIKSSELFSELCRRMVIAGLSIDQAEEMFRGQIIRTTLSEEVGNISRAAKRLDIHRNTLMRNTRALHIDPKVFKKTRKKPVQPVRGQELAGVHAA